MEAELGGIMSTEEAAEAVGVPVWVLTQAARQGRVRFTRKTSGRSGRWDTGRLQFLLRDVKEWYEEYQPDCHGINQVRTPGMLCANCKRTDKIYAKFLCRACYEYQRTNGEPRPIKSDEPAEPEPIIVNSRTRIATDDDGIEWVTQSEAAEMMSISRERVRQLIKLGKLRGKCLGNDKAPRVRKIDIETRMHNK